MPASFQEILNSKLLKFTVGEAVDGTPSEFSVHVDAIAQLSKPLHTLVKSSPEARAGRAIWKDVSKDTFERFVQYAYTGDYSIPKTEKRTAVIPPKKKAKAATEKAEKESKEAALKAEKEAVPEPEETHPTETQPADPEPTPLADEEKSSEQHILTTDFQSLSYPLLSSRNNYEGTCEPATDFEKDHSYSKVFLSHTSLYLLAEAQLVDSLKALALLKLHKTLCAFELENENIGDITDLARYAYSKENTELDEGLGGLRGLVCQYMAIHAVELSADVRFMNLLAGGGQIVKDFFKFQLQRIH
ncbi:hypothetical protein B0O99DRAFT_650146 [Bisporella sp. PMI_857]|nr:hypothetical protein B0O99DRAFT_650146 [Bisporella sp. PMI_857]